MTTMTKNGINNDKIDNNRDSECVDYLNILLLRTKFIQELTLHIEIIYLKDVKDIQFHTWWASTYYHPKMVI